MSAIRYFLRLKKVVITNMLLDRDLRGGKGRTGAGSTFGHSAVLFKVWRQQRDEWLGPIELIAFAFFL
jgi:hypothetical protein